MSWVSLEKWWLKHAPEVVERLSAGADPAGLAAAERVTGFDWPADYRAWLLEHDGASGILPVVLMNVSGVVATWRMLGELHASREHDDLVRAEAGVRAHWWQAGWLPITADGAGNHLCLDLAPAAGGRVGQVIEFWHDGRERRVLAPSFAAWLSSVQVRLESGDLVTTVEHGVMERASLRRVLVVCRILGESEADWRARIATEKRLDPGWVLVSMITSLNRYQLIELADSAPFAIPSILKDLERAGVPIDAGALHAALSQLPQVTRVAVSVTRLAEILEAFPFVRELLGEPPIRAKKKREVDPLESLADSLEDGEPPGDDWSDQRLVAMWAACVWPRRLLHLLAHTVPVRELLGALCELIRELRSEDELQFDGYLTQIEAIEAWSADRLTDDELHGRPDFEDEFLCTAALAERAFKRAAKAACVLDGATESEAARQRAIDFLRKRFACPPLAMLVAATARAQRADEAFQDPRDLASGGEDTFKPKA